MFLLFFFCDTDSILCVSKQFKQNLKYAMRAVCFVGIVELRPRQRNVMNHMDHVLCMGMCVCVFLGGSLFIFFGILFRRCGVSILPSISL